MADFGIRHSSFMASSLVSLTSAFSHKMITGGAGIAANLRKKGVGLKNCFKLLYARFV